MASGGWAVAPGRGTRAWHAGVARGLVSRARLSGWSQRVASELACAWRLSRVQDDFDASNFDEYSDDDGAAQWIQYNTPQYEETWKSEFDQT